MPLRDGNDPKAISANIQELVATGRHTHEQAVAIALEHSGRRQDDPAHALAARVAFHRQIGLGARRRAMPPQARPLLIEMEYAKELVQLIEQLRTELAPLLAELPAILTSAARDLGTSDERTDVGEERRVRQMLEKARRRMADWMNDARIRGVIEKYAGRASSFQRAQLLRQLRAALGVDALILDKKLASRVSMYVEENVAYITDLEESVIAGIEKLVFRAISTGQKPEQLAEAIAKRFDVGISRAKGIAADQISKLVGRLNADRQQELGITQYRWRTRRDPRVRPEHAAREGKVYAWKGKGRAPYIPGEEFGCRCYAEPVMDGVLGHLAELTKTTVPPRRPNARPRRSDGIVPAYMLARADRARGAPLRG